MKLDFTKMHGLGNDMIIIDARENGFSPSPEQARFLCDRRFGIGADQLLLLLPSDRADFRMRIFNADGGEVEMCGNGIRCLARYLHDRGISRKNPLEIETLAGIIKPEIQGDLVRVDMGEPSFDPEKIPVKADRPLIDYPLQVDDETFKVTAVSMGNPHCVIPVDDVNAVPLKELGPRLEHHPLFPQRTNVEFVEALGPNALKVRVWERGAGETLACGTGACACAVALHKLGKTEAAVTVSLPGGELMIEWNRETNRVWMTGPATEVFNGTILLD